MREKLRKYGSNILYYSLSFIATLIAWLAHDLDRIGVLKEVDFALELMWWLILKLNGTLSDEWCVGDQITATYTNE